MRLGKSQKNKMISKVIWERLNVLKNLWQNKIKEKKKKEWAEDLK